jgi:hypothetical protein
VKAGVWKCGGTVSRHLLDAVSDLVEKVDRKARMPWMTQEMISKMNKGSGRVSTMKKEGGTKKSEEQIEKSHR